MRLVIAALLICFGLGSPASARTEFALYGARGDEGHTDECPAGQFLMGVEARAGAWIDQVAVVCGALSADGSLVRKDTLHRRGGDGGASTESVCGSNEAVSQMRAWRNDTYQIRSIELTCQNVKTGAARIIGVRGTQTSPDAHSGPQACRLPERGAGLVIRHGRHVSGLALVCDTRLPPAAPNTARATIAAGSWDQEIVLRTRTVKGVETTKFKIFTYRPTCNNPNLMLVFHGVGQNASGYRDNARQIADALCLIVVAPLFDDDRFKEWAYQHGGIVRDDKVLPQSEWTVRYVPEFVRWAQSVEGRRLELYLLGHSGGAQFLSRVAAFLPTAARRIVVANPSTHVFPDSTMAPWGFGGVYSAASAPEQMRRYLATPVTIFLGQQDTGNNDLEVTPQANAQGANRLVRGHNAFKAGEALARQKGWPFSWCLVEAPGVGHTAGGMFRAPEAIKAVRDSCRTTPVGWAAVAVNEKGVSGFAVGQSNEQVAREKALAGCGAQRANCKVVATGQARCLAYSQSTQGGYWLGVGLKDTAAEATQIANETCERGAPRRSCKLAAATCG